MNSRISTIWQLLQLSDSALPIGAFSFSSALESGVAHGIVTDAQTLQQYAADMVRQTALCDGIASIQAYRACRHNNYYGVVEADNHIFLSKMNTEARAMTLKMGRKMSELAGQILEHPFIERWIYDINGGAVHGCLPSTQAMIFALCEIDEQEMFASQLYGVAAMIVGAALRLIRVSHYQTQQIMFRLSTQIPELYSEVHDLQYEDMQSFIPQADILFALHEQGSQRMFMS